MLLERGRSRADWRSLDHRSELLRLFDLLHSERDHTSSNLDGLRLVYLQLDVLVSKDQGPKLRKVVLNVELIRLGVELEQRMAPADRDVADPQIRLMPSAHLELLVRVVGHDHVDHSRRVFLKSQGL